MTTMATRLPKKLKATTEALRSALEPTRLTLPMPPTTNHLRMPVRGRLVTSPEYRKWQEEAAHALWTHNQPTPILGAVGVHIQVCPTDKRIRDLDNTANFKAILDLLVRHGVIEGDDRRYVRYLSASWDDVGTEKRIVVTIKPAVY